MHEQCSLKLEALDRSITQFLAFECHEISIFVRFQCHNNFFQGLAEREVMAIETPLVFWTIYGIKADLDHYLLLHAPQILLLLGSMRGI